MNVSVMVLICGAVFVLCGIKVFRGWPVWFRHTCALVGFVLLSIAAFQLDAQGGGWGVAIGAVFGVFAILTVLSYIAYRYEKQLVEEEDL